MPLPGTEDAQRKFWLALSKSRVEQIGDVTDAHESEIVNRRTTEVGEILDLASSRAQAEIAVAAAENFGTVNIAMLRYGVETTDASYRGQADLMQAGYQIDNIKAEADYSVGTIQGEATSQINATLAEASARASNISATAAAQKSLIDGEAVIDASRYASLANFTVSEINARIGQDSSTALAVARIEAGTITTEASIRATETSQVTTLEVANISAETAIDVSTSASLATIEAGYIAADAAQQARATIESAAIRSTAARKASDIRVVATTQRAQIDAGSIVALAVLQAGYDVYVAEARATASRVQADNDYTASVYAADRRYNLDVYRADSQYDSTVSTSDIGLQATRYSATSDHDKVIAVAVIDATARRLEADDDYQSLVDREDGRTTLAMRRLAWRKENWDSVIPAFNATKAGPVLPNWWKELPTLYRPTPITRSALNRMVNKEFASADAEVYDLCLSAGSESGGRGWTAAGVGVEMIRSGVESASSLRKAAAYSSAFLDSFKKNADALAKSQSAAATAFAAQNDAAISAEKNFGQRQVGYLEQAASYGS